MIVIFIDAPTEQEIEAGDGVPKEEVPCVTTHVEVIHYFGWWFCQYVLFLWRVNSQFLLFTIQMTHLST